MPWVKAFHIFFMVSWFAGVFYLPRLFVYHAMASDQATRDQLKVMERKLYRFVTPMMWLTIALGLWMLWDYAWVAWSSMGWLHAKITLVTLLVAYHFYCGHLVKRFAADEMQRSHVWFRWFNEVPVLILLPVVILTIVKPF